MGYPFFWLNTSRSLQVPPPPLEIPATINILWVGFAIDMLIYSLPGLAASYLMFTLKENMRLLKFLVSSGAAIFFGSFVTSLFLIRAGVNTVSSAMFTASVLTAFVTPTITAIYGYYRLIKKRVTEPKREATTGPTENKRKYTHE
jgi:hypothetical protein